MYFSSPYYGSYGYGSRYGYGGYGYSSPYYDYGYGSYSNGYYQPRALTVLRPANVATLEIRLPDPEGELWLQGIKQGGSGTVRQFHSPSLDPASDYTYTVTAAWHQDGRLVTREQRVGVRANTSVVVDFTRPPATPPARAADPPETPETTPPLPTPAIPR